MAKYIKASDVYSLFRSNGFAYLHVSDIDQLRQVEFEDPKPAIHWILNGEHISPNGYQVKEYKCPNCFRITPVITFGKLHTHCGYCGNKNIDW